ncbi:MAG: DNA-processing protein DprA [Actinomycetota bacterium]
MIAPGSNEWIKGLSDLGPHLPPRKLYVAGRRIDPDARRVAVVGTRRPTAAGLEAAEMIAKGLAQANFVVVSGLAMGIDAVAHRATLDSDGHTIAVLGGGMDLDYPKSNSGLRRRIEARGTIVTEYPDGTPPHKHHFPLRNRIIVGLCEAVVVVEGSVKSGALITGRLGLDANRHVFAVPGSIRNPYAAGPNELIRCQEAIALTDVQHIFDELAPGLVWSDNELPLGPVGVDQNQARVLAVLDDFAVTADFIVTQTGMPRGLVLLTLSKLEIRGLAKRWNGAYELTSAGARIRAAASPP